jgi:hypothetical protein
MRRVRLTPEALNSPLEILGVQRVVFFVLLVVSLVITQKYRWDVGVISFLVCFGIAQLVNRKERDWFAILPACFRFQMDRAYDPCEREYFQLVIVEDSSEEED